MLELKKNIYFFLKKNWALHDHSKSCFNYDSISSRPKQKKNIPLFLYFLTILRIYHFKVFIWESDLSLFPERLSSLP